MLATLPRFPCGKDKRPLVAGGFYGAKSDWPDDSGWPLTGVPTGSASGFDVLDIDPEGMGWYDLNFDALPLTRAHSTRRGLHLLFRHADGLRCSTGRIASGVDVKADGGFFFWWPREGLPFEDLPICEWPDWLLELAAKTVPKRDLPRSFALMGSIAGGALDALNVREYRNHGDWLRLMMGCHAAGIDREAFIRWSASDPLYSDDADEIGRRWDSLRRDGGITAWALRVEVRLAQLKKGICPKHRDAWEVPICSDPETEFDHRRFNRRISGLLETARQNEPLAFWASCQMREFIAEGRIGPNAAVQLLRGAGVSRRTIASGFLTVEDKLSEEEKCNGGEDG